PERSAGNPEPARAEPLAEVRDRAGPERDVDLRVQLEQPLALGLRVAAADRDHRLRVRALVCDCVAEMGRELRVRLLPDRAGVEDEDVCGFGLDRLPEAELLEHALDPL